MFLTMKPFLSLLFGLLLAAGCSAPEQREVRSDGDLAVGWALLRNDLDNGGAAARFTISNRGQLPLPADGWALYFSQLAGGVRPASLPEGISIEALSGDWYRLQPTAAFQPVPPGDSLAIDYETMGAVNKVVWAPQGLYIVYTDEDGRELDPVAISDYTIAPFTEKAQIDRGPGDRVPIPTPAHVFQENAALSQLPPGELTPLLPTPVSYQAEAGSITIDADTRILFSEGLQGQAAYLSGRLKALTGRSTPREAGEKPAADVILLRTGPVTVNGRIMKNGSEAYALTTSPENGVQITGADAAGVFYGIQSLLMLFPQEAYRTPQATSQLPAVRIADAPRFGYRGLHLDVARNFQKKESVLRMLDLMATYKLNKFHLHFSEDEGWRLEIPELPELTEVGGRRGHTLTEEEFLHPAYGSGPDPAIGASFGSGYYSRADYIEILRYAAERQIEVIPEIEMPGHARAAIVAMKARQRRTGSDEYILHDPADASEYRSVQGYNDNVLCPCQESTYRFIETVVRSIVAMHEEAGAPLSMLHIGGDEVPAGVWEDSPACAELIAENPKVNDVVDINYYWVRRSGEILQRYGLKTAGWEEIGLERVAAPEGELPYRPQPEFSGGNFIPYVWNNLGAAVDLGNRLANAGYPVVLCSVTNLYFDLAYNKDPLEPGLTWGGFIRTRTAWDYAPFDVFKSTTVDPMGNQLDTEAFYRQRESLTEAGRRNILGIQGELWSETLKGAEMLEYYTFPKLLGLAERAWAPQPDWATIRDREQRGVVQVQAWNRFANRLGQKALPRLDYLYGGVAYRLAPPGAVIENGQLRANVAFPGLTIRYTTDGTEPTADSPVYEGPVEVSGLVKLRTFDTKGRGSRTISVEGGVKG